VTSGSAGCTLLLLRDVDRPLAGRGERAAAAIGVWLRQRGLEPDLALCSPARRARETLRIVRHQLDTRGSEKIVAALYPGSPGEIAAAVRNAGEARRCILVVGHDPGLGQAALWLAREDRGDLRAQVKSSFPTGGLARLEVSRWRDLAAGTAELVSFVVPKRLV
jgi:phosphohistidine phosphatase